MRGACRTGPVLLMFQGFLHLAEFPLNLPGRLFNYASRLQAAIVRQFSRLLLDLAIYFVKLAFGLISGASLHRLLLKSRFRAAAGLFRTLLQMGSAVR